MSENILQSYGEDIKYSVPGIIVGVITGLIGRAIAVKFKLNLISRIAFQLFLLFTVSYIVKSMTTDYIEGAPKSTGNFQAFYFGVQVYLFIDIADFFGMRIKDSECR